MEFVTVRRADGGTADITLAEVPAYRAMGFVPLDTVDLTGLPAGRPAASAGGAPPAATSTDQRLDLVIEELRGLRVDLVNAFQPSEGELAALPALELNLEPLLDELRGLRADLGGPVAAPVTDGDPVELREPAVNIETMKRPELDAYAASRGIDPKAFANRDALIAAIRTAGDGKG